MMVCRVLPQLLQQAALLDQIARLTDQANEDVVGFAGQLDRFAVPVELSLSRREPVGTEASIGFAHAAILPVDRLRLTMPASVDYR